MKKNTIPSPQIPELTIGLDLSDRTFQFCEMKAGGEIVAEGALKLNRTRERGAGKGAAALVPVSAHIDPERDQRSAGSPKIPRLM